MAIHNTVKAAIVGVLCLFIGLLFGSVDSQAQSGDCLPTGCDLERFTFAQSPKARIVLAVPGAVTATAQS